MTLPTDEKQGERQHELKTWPEFFAEQLAGRKPFELRKNDRDFRVGDKLWLREYDPAADLYSGRDLVTLVTYILEYRPDAGCAATFGLKPEYVIMGTRPLLQEEGREARSGEEHHAVEHARFQFKHSSPARPECCFDFELIGTLLKIIDRAALPPSGQVRGWQPIETAPKDGTRILLFQRGRGAFEGWWHAEHYWMDDQDSEPNPTHWQPLLSDPPLLSSPGSGG